MNSTLAPNFKKSGKYTAVRFNNCWKACLTAGVRAEWKGRYDRAERLFKRALRLIDESRQPNTLYAITTLMYLADLYMDQKKYKEAEAPLKSALTLCEGVIHVNAQAVPTNGAPTPSLSAESAQAEIFAAHGLRCLAKIFHVRGRRAEASLLATKAISAYTGTMAVSIKHGRPDLASLGSNNDGIAQAKREIVKEAATLNNLFYKITDATGDFIKVKHSYTETRDMRSSFLEAAGALLEEGRARLVFKNKDLELYEIVGRNISPEEQLSRAKQKLLEEAADCGNLYRIHSPSGEYVQCSEASHSEPEDIRLTYLRALNDLVREGKLNLLNATREISSYALSHKLAQGALKKNGNPVL